MAARTRCILKKKNRFSRFLIFPYFCVWVASPEWFLLGKSVRYLMGEGITPQLRIPRWGVLKERILYRHSDRGWWAYHRSCRHWPLKKSNGWSSPLGSWCYPTSARSALTSFVSTIQTRDLTCGIIYIHCLFVGARGPCSFWTFATTWL